VADIRRRAIAGALAAMLALAPAAARVAAADGFAVDDTYSVAEDTDLAVTADIGVLANDAGGSLALCVVSSDTTGLQGALADPPLVAPDGSFLYTPPPNFNGTTTFTYVVASKVGDSCPQASAGTATVTITVTPVNDAPTAVADGFIALKDHTLNVAAPGVLGNDSDVDGDALSAVKTSSPAHGVVTLAPDGGFSYKPAAGFVGSDAFAYKASDGTDQSLQRIVTINVVDLPPTPSPTPSPTPTPVPATATPESSPSESPAPSDSALPTESPLETAAIASASASPAPVTGPVSSEGGPPLIAIAALALLIGLLAVAAVYFVRSQGAGEDPAFAEGEPFVDEGPFAEDVPRD
jgi:hypothetical protein